MTQCRAAALWKSVVGRTTIIQCSSQVSVSYSHMSHALTCVHQRRVSPLTAQHTDRVHAMPQLIMGAFK